MVTISKAAKIDDVLMYYASDVINSTIPGDFFDGDKFPGSFGFTRNYFIENGIDYYTLRHRSMQLFIENSYFAGIIKRMLRNEIFTGMYPESTPISGVIWPDLSEEEREAEAVKYSEMMSTAFSLYGNDYGIFDYKQQHTFGEFQNQVRLESILCGDGIIVSRVNQQSGLPCWQFINGNHIKTPPEYNIAEGHEIKHGVELDRQGRHAAYWIEEFDRNGDGFTYTRIPVWGKKSKRQISWMVYGGEKLLDHTRGTPLLANCLFMLKDLDRYRDAEVRAAVINSILPLFIKRTATSKGGTNPVSGFLERKAGANPRPEVKIDGKSITEANAPLIGMNAPGLIMDRLEAGEEPESFQTNRPNVNFGKFEEIIVSAICWQNEIPPEIVLMRFNTSYSASRQANNEYEITLNFRAYKNAKDFCQIIFNEFIIQSVLIGDLVMPGFMAIMFAPSEWRLRGAWLKCEWRGLSRGSVDIKKEVDGLTKLANYRCMTKDIICRRFTGMSYNAVMYIIAREKKLAERLGLVSAEDENNNGEPIYQNGNSEGIEELKDSIQELSEMLMSSGRVQ
jgi:capsid protein